MSGAAKQLGAFNLTIVHCARRGPRKCAVMAHCVSVKLLIEFVRHFHRPPQSLRIANLLVAAHNQLYAIEETAQYWLQESYDEGDVEIPLCQHLCLSTAIEGCESAHGTIT